MNRQEITREGGDRAGGQWIDLLPEEEWLLFRRAAGRELLDYLSMSRAGHSVSEGVGPGTGGSATEPPTGLYRRAVLEPLAELYPKSVLVVGPAVLGALLLELRVLGCTEAEGCTYRGLCRLGADSVLGGLVDLPRLPGEGWLYGGLVDLAGNRRQAAQRLAKRLQRALTEDVYADSYRYNQYYQWEFAG